MQIITQLVADIEANKGALAVAAAWVVREYPFITSEGGLFGIIKNFVVGKKPSSPPDKVSVPSTVAATVETK